jgi:DNA-binding transcriptional MerR regulator
MKTFAIGQLARETGSKVQTVRYYEEIGLLPAPRRTAGHQRVYDAAHRDRLAFIRHARELGFPLDAIRELLELSDRPQQSCARADRIASAHLEDVESRIARLESLRAELKRMIRSCRRGHVADCRVIQVLADHSHAGCLSDAHGEEMRRFGS